MKDLRDEGIPLGSISLGPFFSDLVRLTYSGCYDIYYY